MAEYMQGKTGSEPVTQTAQGASPDAGASTFEQIGNAGMLESFGLTSGTTPLPELPDEALLEYHCDNIEANLTEMLVNVGDAEGPFEADMRAAPDLSWEVGLASSCAQYGIDLAFGVLKSAVANPLASATLEPILDAANSAANKQVVGRLAGASQTERRVAFARSQADAIYAESAQAIRQWNLTKQYLKRDPDALNRAAILDHETLQASLRADQAHYDALVAAWASLLAGSANGQLQGEDGQPLGTDLTRPAAGEGHESGILEILVTGADPLQGLIPLKYRIGGLTEPVRRGLEGQAIADLGLPIVVRGAVTLGGRWAWPIPDLAGAVGQMNFGLNETGVIFDDLVSLPALLFLHEQYHYGEGGCGGEVDRDHVEEMRNELVAAALGTLTADSIPKGRLDA